MKKSNVMMLATMVAAVFLLMAFVIPQDQKKPGPWEIPAKYQKMENPYADDADLVKVGKMLYSKHCKSCHGNTGAYDGPKAKQLETWCASFADPDFQAQSDGVLYYKSFIGRDEMPNFEKKIPDEEDQWAVINFIRTLK
jgi:mono/diheme cytochrome c family protein